MNLPASLIAAKQPVPPLVKTGDTAGAFTFLGVDERGKLLCRCACGSLEAVIGKLLAQPLKPQSHRRLPRVALLKCAGCRDTAAKLAASGPHI